MKKAILLLLVVIGFRSANAQKTINAGSHRIDPQIKIEVYKVLDQYLTAFNAKDLNAWERTYQFPHYRLASGKISVLEKTGLRDPKKVFGELQQQGWDHSKWDHRNIIQASGDKVHVDTEFSRYRKDGSLIGHYESLYILTKENGRWGIKFRSSYAD
ncbi:hypothetical protein [Mucilaginibacter paludis]|uniref:Nuclear transport factor 2 family protein n=1 Tax=Mucilaginibacter paludis DSM 18603 TaxID=714943 RepID=H1YA06_9SPHI|nr:hypothetical protein [Mucilaginibacter paludis]EHQ24990.1 hypothetical protein Mucpa_0809 [Mucilaginibacter paludis DSM 18603]